MAACVKFSLDIKVLRRLQTKTSSDGDKIICYELPWGEGREFLDDGRTIRAQLTDQFAKDVLDRAFTSYCLYSKKVDVLNVMLIEHILVNARFTYGHLTNNCKSTLHEFTCVFTADNHPTISLSSTELESLKEVVASRVVSSVINGCATIRDSVLLSQGGV